eukprot:TRINITY_DN10_c0_g1_i2.p1 TRINITY_DN10_c0_g1~~TRINITY_DN10_c0_g1_i2.p1  ORF type:complete len:157 (+),score=44.58 TRINITY_DN10_c0_g1_i2:27-473(+)
MNVSSLGFVLVVLAVLAPALSMPVFNGCMKNEECYDDNKCTVDVCEANGECTHRFAGGDKCCEFSGAECPYVRCYERGCNVDIFTCRYRSSTNSECQTQYDEFLQEYGFDDVIGAIIGFAILGILILIFISIVLFILTRRVIRDRGKD